MTEWQTTENLPSELTEVVCYCPGIDGMMPGKDWMDSDFCIGMHVNGNWKRVDNENINVSHWLTIPKIDELSYEFIEHKEKGGDWDD